MKEYLVLLAQQYPEFRCPELELLAALHNVTVDLSQHNPESPFMVVRLEDDDAAKKLMYRLVLGRRIYELWGHGTTLDELHSDVKSRMASNFDAYKHLLFKFDFIGYMGKRLTTEKRQIIDGFRYTGWEGKIDLKNPDNVFTVLEEYHTVGQEKASKPDHLWFGREIQQLLREANIIQKYDLKTRTYIGTTLFDAELSLVTANLGHAGPNKLVYDPFAGTGLFLVAAANFGSLTMGSDIDARALRGKGPGKDIHANFKQYGTLVQLVDLMGMDFTHNALRPLLAIDSIICDPPYGVREGLKVCGARNPERAAGRENVVIEGEKAHLRRDFIPPKKPYLLLSMLEDLLQFAAERLPVGGRLAFWMPTANDDFEETLIPQHERLELLYHLEQEFHKWLRRLVVYVKREEQWRNVTRNGLRERNITDFRQRYFDGFKKESTEETE